MHVHSLLTYKKDVLCRAEQQGWDTGAGLYLVSGIQLGDI